MLQQSIIVNTLQIFIRIELVFKFTIIFQEGLVYHEFEIVSSEWFSCIHSININQMVIKSRFVNPVLLLHEGVWII